MAIDWQDSVPPDWPQHLRAAWLQRKGDPPPSRASDKKAAPYTAEWASLCKALSEQAGAPICGARTTTNGWPCKKRREPGMAKCRYHGGHSPTGPASPHWEHGAYSYHVPGDLAEKYQRAMEDPDYLSVKKEIALATARHQQLLDQLATGEGPDAWRRVEALAGDLALAMAEGRSDDIQQIGAALSELAEQGIGDWAKWRELRDNADHLRKLRNTERMRMESLQLYLNAEKGTAMVARLLGMLRNILDRTQLHELMLQLQAEGLLRPQPTHRGGLAPGARDVTPHHTNGGSSG